MVFNVSVIIELYVGFSVHVYNVSVNVAIGDI